MDFLKHSLAPLTERAWEFLEQEASRTLRADFTARRFVDVQGPRGFDFSAVNLGGLGETRDVEGVRFGVRRVLPLVEARIDFSLDIWGLDDLSRGAADAETEPLRGACQKLTTFEDRAVLRGFAPGGIEGLITASDHSPVPLGDEAGLFPSAVARAIMAMNDRGVAGPFALILGPEPYRQLSAELAPYPPRTRIEKLIEGPVLYTPVIEAGILVSMRGGDFELTIGQDASIGYQGHDAERVQLYLTESFTFRVLGPEASIPLTRSG